MTTRIPNLRRQKRGPRVVTFVNQKGGVGKSQSTGEVGAVAASAGNRVLVVDGDGEQHTLTDWAQQLGESAPFDFAVLTDPSELADLHEIAADYDLVLIDTPGNRSNKELVAAFLDISDFVVIASEVDGMALKPADRYINELVVPAGKPYSVLLTKVDARSSEQEKRARDFFAEAEQPVFADAIHLYRAFAGALEDGVVVSMGTSRRGRFRKAAKEYEPVTRDLLSALSAL